MLKEKAGKSFRSNFRNCLTALGIVMLTSAALIATPVHAAPPVWDLPDGVTVDSRMQYHIDEDTGEVNRRGPVAPGRTFFVGFTLLNNSDDPVTVTGFDTHFIFMMHPDRQGGYSLDHCEQFFETRDIPHRVDQQLYPVVIGPGETVELFDNTTYHYIRDTSNPSNECQAGSMYFGAPVFSTVEPDDPLLEPVLQRDSAEGAANSEVPPVPPVAVDTGRR